MLVFLIQTHSPARLPPSRTSTPTPPSATSPAPTPSTSSSASAWRGPSPPSPGAPRARRSRWTRETWPSPSPSSPSWPWCVWSRFCTGGGRRWPAESWAGRGLARWSRRWCSCRCGWFTSCWLHWRPTAIYQCSKWRGGGGRETNCQYEERERGRDEGVCKEGQDEERWVVEVDPYGPHLVFCYGGSISLHFQNNVQCFRHFFFPSIYLFSWNTKSLQLFIL